MVNVEAFYSSGDFMKASDLTESKTVTIKGIEETELNGKPKIVLLFSDFGKQLVLNKINSTIITKNLGSSETDNWIGKKITLEKKRTEFQGTMVDAVRVAEASASAYDYPGYKKGDYII